MALRVDARTRAQLDALVHELKIARSNHSGLSQRLLAERLGVTPGSIVDWEVRRDSPTMFHLIRWAHALSLVLRIAEREGAPLRYQLLDSEMQDSWDVREMRELALALHAARLAEGRSQVDVASELGLNRWSISQWESGQGHPRPIGLVAWANALRCAVILRPAARE
ncbi:helix-turn-helix transcriptional regulator [Actinocrinis sp.]|uniref:helix-turn-helix domain-containing protein n=1 Tax=Actinocrinis sp. TaxID=1920516 RepID=UPI002D5EEC3E|nr:helix-turn-helix transcriptional regulator [Actinocrinis sp.]HZP53132.1 helix-turn-helix transcriptional regulator [Actinocrinis sp.]